MGSKPKPTPPSDAEKASASVAKAEYDYFKKNYDPLLQQMRDESMSGDNASKLRGRSNADTMQALTSQPSYQATQNVQNAGDVGQALQGQLGLANANAAKIQNQMQSNVLGTARGQAADAQSGMAEAARLQTSQALERARGKQQVSAAKMSAAAQIGGAALAQGISNMQTTGLKTPTSGVGPPQQVKGSFFSPVNAQGQKVSGLGNRINYSGFFGPGSSV